MAASTSLTSLTEREAIADAVYRCINGFDYPDKELFESTMLPDSSLDIDGREMKGIEAVRAECYDFVSTLDTTHLVSNLRIDVKPGASTAHVTASALAQHYRPGQGKQPGATYFLAGCLYFIDLVKDDKDGLWKIKHWKIKLNWFDGDQGIMTGN